MWQGLAAGSGMLDSGASPPPPVVLACRPLHLVPNFARCATVRSPLEHSALGGEKAVSRAARGPGTFRAIIACTSMGVREQVQGVTFLQELPPPLAPTQPLCGKLNHIFPTSGFDDFVVQGYLHFSYAPRGRSTLLLGTSFRLLLFGNDSECGIALRGCDTSSCREFLSNGLTETVLGHSTPPPPQRSDLRTCQRDLRGGTPPVAGRGADGSRGRDHPGRLRGTEHAVELRLGAFGGLRCTEDRDGGWCVGRSPLGRACGRSGRQRCNGADVAGRRTGRHDPHRPNADGGGVRAGGPGSHEGAGQSNSAGTGDSRAGAVCKRRCSEKVQWSKDYEGQAERRKFRRLPNKQDKQDKQEKQERERDNEHCGRGDLGTRS